MAVDSVSPTVFCIADSGELIKWFDCSDYMREPSDIAISGKDYFVCDFKVGFTLEHFEPLDNFCLYNVPLPWYGMLCLSD